MTSGKNFLLIGAALMIASFCMPVSAQTNTFVFNVPFSFTANRQTFPAGEYKLVRDVRNGYAWYKLNGMTSGNHAVLMPHSVESPANAHQPSLRFVNVGGQYALYQIWTVNEHYGAELSVTELKKSLVAHNPPVDVVAEGHQ